MFVGVIPFGSNNFRDVLKASCDFFEELESMEGINMGKRSEAKEDKQ
jgi:hypothetical protein